MQDSSHFCLLPVLGCYGCTISQALHAFDNDLLANTETRSHVIATVGQFTQLDWFAMHLPQGIKGPHLRLSRDAHHSLLRNHKRFGVGGVRHPCPHEHTRQQLALGVVHQHAQQHVAGSGIDIDAREQDAPLYRIGLTVAAQYRHW